MWSLRVCVWLGVCACSSYARLARSPDVQQLETYNTGPDTELERKQEVSAVASFLSRERQERVLGAVWAVDLHYLTDELTLRMCGQDEADRFHRTIGPVIQQMSSEEGVLTDTPGDLTSGEGEGNDVTREGEGEGAARREIWEIVNKFIVSTDTEIHPTVTLYINSRNSAIVLSSGGREWHFVIRPPSPLPAWLYNHAHKQAAIPRMDAGNVALPPLVQRRLYASLAVLMKEFLRFDL